MVQDNTRLLQQRVQCDQARSMRAAAAWAARLILVLHADGLVVFPVVDLTRLRAVVELVSLLLFAFLLSDLHERFSRVVMQTCI